MAKPPRLDRSRPKTIGAIHPPMILESGGVASFEQDHHYFDVHGAYLASHPGYEPGHDAGAPADALISGFRTMSDEAREKIMRELGLTVAPKEPAKPPRRRAPAVAALAQVATEPGEDIGDGGDDAGDTKSNSDLLPRGPRLAQADNVERVGGIDLVGWAKGELDYPGFTVTKAWATAYPDRPAKDFKSVLDGMVAVGLITAEEINRG